MEEFKTPDQWLASPEYKGITVVDPDGWDRENLEKDWKVPLTKEEFNMKLFHSTCLITH